LSADEDDPTIQEERRAAAGGSVKRARLDPRAHLDPRFQGLGQRLPLPAPAIRLLRRGRHGLRELRIDLEDVRARLGMPRAAWDVRLPPQALDVVLARNEFGVYCVPAAGRGFVPRTVRRGRVWEHETLNYMRTIEGDVVHAGAFFGDFLPALAASRQGTVWAFEPSLENYRCARITVELNGLENVELIRAGLSDSAGEAFVTVADGSGKPRGGTSFLMSSSPRYGRSETVPLLTIDGAVPAEARVGLLHLDVEGHEQQALGGALETIRRCRPVVIVETVPPLEWLERHLPGYGVSQRLDANTVLVPLSPAP